MNLIRGVINSMVLHSVLGKACILLGVGVLFACIALAVRVERVRESGLLGGVNGQVVVVLDLDPCNDVVAFEGIERGEPDSRVLVALGLIEVIGDGDQLGPSEVIGKLFAASGSPVAGSADPGFLQRDDMVLEMTSRSKRRYPIFGGTIADLRCRDQKPRWW